MLPEDMLNLFNTDEEPLPQYPDSHVVDERTNHDETYMRVPVIEAVRWDMPDNTYLRVYMPAERGFVAPDDAPRNDTAPVRIEYGDLVGEHTVERNRHGTARLDDAVMAYVDRQLHGMDAGVIRSPTRISDRYLTAYQEALNETSLAISRHDGTNIFRYRIGNSTGVGFGSHETAAETLFREDEWFDDADALAYRE